VEVDQCPTCRGIWLDKGEIFLFATDAKALSDRIRKGLAEARPTSRLSPRSGEPMREFALPDGGPTLDFSPESGGLWLDGTETAQALALPEVEGLRPDAVAPRAARTLLPRLPNLAFRAVATVGMLYGFLALALIALSLFAGVPPEAVLVGGVAVSLIHFVAGPWMMDLSLGWLYRMDWVALADLPPHLQAFLRKLCHEKGMPIPRFGMIRDGAPQAFTYGHAPRNARIVVSEGLIDRLDEDELEGVVAHEIGHALHWDMALMTVAQLVPLVLHAIYRTLIRMKGNDRNGGPRLAVAVGAYLLYIVSAYLVLWLSRTREYHADRFGGEATGNPGALASALVKIAYGLAGQEPRQAEGREKAERQPRLEAVGALGIFDAGTARNLALAAHGPAAARARDPVNKETLAAAMRWDLWNPWAGWFELNSTHPLPAKRLLHLSAQGAHRGQKPYIVFDERRPESYWDEFLVDLLVHLSPAAGLLLGAVVFLTGGWNANLAFGLSAIGWSMGYAGLLLFMYRERFFPEASVAALLKAVKVSAVRPVPCTLTGTVIGRGVPGYLFSEDFVLDDGTGIMFLDYRQPLALWEAIFAFVRADKFQGKRVTVTGWYRRAPVPFVEVKEIRAEDGTSSKSWLVYAKMAVAALAALGGSYLLVFQPLDPALGMF
jgi:Zn-dependent protease with chaperone function/Zn-finger nucleic acid-binding protein